MTALDRCRDSGYRSDVESARARVTQRLAELEQIHASYLQYQNWRIAERDHHGAWDAAINLAETEAEMAGLRFALGAMVA